MCCRELPPTPDRDVDVVETGETATKSLVGEVETTEAVTKEAEVQAETSKGGG